MKNFGNVLNQFDMKKIMFNDKYGLTEAVLNGMKTQTRRIMPSGFHKYLKVCEKVGFRPTLLRMHSKYKIGEEVAIAQKYSDIEYLPFTREFDIKKGGKERAGWDNKMFVEAIYMPHHIKITNVRVERLQDISSEDCLAEGITDNCGLFEYTENTLARVYITPIGAYASLVDKVSGKGTWESNPWVFVYEFELVD